MGPSATRFLFEIMRSCFVRDCKRLGKVGPFGFVLGTTTQVEMFFAARTT